MLAELERVRAEAAALQSGQGGAETDQHVLESAEQARHLVNLWKDAAARAARFANQTPGERLDEATIAERRCYPDVLPANLHELIDDIARARHRQEHLESRLRELATSKLPEPGRFVKVTQCRWCRRTGRVGLSPAPGGVAPRIMINSRGSRS